MPRQIMETYYSEEQLKKQVDRLNALTSEWFQWQRTSARKQHEDLFGEIINKGETYFKRDVGPAWGDTIKLSQISMERLIFALFDANGALEKFADEAAERRWEALREAHRRASPVAALLRNRDEPTE